MIAYLTGRYATARTTPGPAPGSRAHLPTAGPTAMAAQAGCLNGPISWRCIRVNGGGARFRFGDGHDGWVEGDPPRAAPVSTQVAV